MTRAVTPSPDTLRPEMARGLIGSIAKALGSPDDNRCDHSHRHGRGWCEGNGIVWPDVLHWLHVTAGYCDCGLLLNIAARIEGEA